MPSTMLPPPGDRRDVHASVDDEATDWGAIDREGEAHAMAHDRWADAKSDGIGPTLEVATWRP